MNREELIEEAQRMGDRIHELEKLGRAIGRNDSENIEYGEMAEKLDDLTWKIGDEPRPDEAVRMVGDPDEPQPVRLPLVICAMADSGQSKLDNLIAEDAELWSLSRRFEGTDIIPARHFELHHPMTVYDPAIYPDSYREWVTDAPQEVWTRHQMLGRSTRRMPFEPIIEFWTNVLGEKPAIESTACWMLALAGMEWSNPGRLWSRIELLGVDAAANDEWASQRPNTEYWIGVLRGRGIPVVIPPESPLCKGIRYMLDTEADTENPTDRAIRETVKKLDAENVNLQLQISENAVAAGLLSDQITGTPEARS